MAFWRHVVLTCRHRRHNNTLPRLEARASSEIENIVTTADQLFRHRQADAGADPATGEAYGIGARRSKVSKR